MITARSIPKLLQTCASVSRWVLRIAAACVCLATPLLAQQAPGQQQVLIPLPHPDIAPPSLPPEQKSWWLTIWATVAVIALLGLVICLLLLRRTEPVKEAVAPIKAALDRLDELRKKVAEMTPSDTAHHVSVILRDYLQARYAVPAPYRTSEELYGDAAIQAREGLRERFGPVAEFHDRLEFAPRPATQADSVKLIEQAQEALKNEKRYAPSSFPHSLSDMPPPSVPYVPTKL